MDLIVSIDIITKLVYNKNRFVDNLLITEQVFTSSVRFYKTHKTIDISTKTR